MPNKVVHYKSIGQVTFFRNRRSKSMKISIKPDKSVLVSFPIYVTEKEVKTFLSQHETWIIQQQQTIDTKRKRFTEGMVINTKMHTIELHTATYARMDLKSNIIKQYAPEYNSELMQRNIEKLITNVYRVEAHLILPDKLDTLATQYGFKYNNVTIRNNKRNWGSCSSQNNISLNLQLMKLPDHLIDYVLLHELVHTEIKDHSTNFWNRLNQITNNRARQLANEVKKYSTYISCQ